MVNRPQAYPSHSGHEDGLCISPDQQASTHGASLPVMRKCHFRLLYRNVPMRFVITTSSWQLIFITEYLSSIGHHLLWTISFYVYLFFIFLCTIIHWVCNIYVYCSHYCMFSATIYLEVIFGKFCLLSQ